MAYWNCEHYGVEVLKDRVVIEIIDADDEIRFITAEGDVFVMYHEQDCCESVYVEDIIGDLDDLIYSPILMAEEVSEDGSGDKDGWYESVTWTFYKFATAKGYVTIRWYGSSNGYYSESVSFIKLDK